MHQTTKITFILFSLLISGYAFAKNTPENELWTSRQLLLDGKFDLLEARLIKANNEYINGEISLGQFNSIGYNFYKAKDFETDQYFHQIEKWLEESPESTYALSTMGISLNGYAFFLRGGDFAQDTEQNQLDQFKENNKKSLTYLLKSLKYSNNNISAYTSLVNLDNFLHNLSFKYDEILNPPKDLSFSLEDWHAPLSYSFDYYQVQHNPSFYKADILNNMDSRLLNKSMIWGTYIFGSVPQWGGSYEEMQSIVDASEKYLSEGQRFYLKSFITNEKMSRLNKNKKYDAVIKMGEQHLKEFHQKNFNISFLGGGVLSNMARAASNTNELDLCINYATKSIEARPTMKDYVRGLLGYCNYLKGNYEEALEPFKQHEEHVKSEDTWGLLYLAMINEKLENPEIAHAISIEALNRKTNEYRDSFKSIKSKMEKIKPELKTTQPFNLKKYLEPKPQYF